MIDQCPFSNEECKYFNRPPQPQLRKEQEHGCFRDTDHKVPQRIARALGKGTLEYLYIYSPDNLQQICRTEHDKKTLAGDDPLPERPQIIESLKQQAEDGILDISKRALKKMIRRDAKHGNSTI